jgi:hypothetical protein
LVGQWRGSSHSEKSVFNVPVEVTIAPDGTFQAGEYDPVTNRFSGRLRIENGRVRYSQRRDTGFLALYEARDKDILTGRISGRRDDGSTAAYVVYLERQTSHDPPPLPGDLNIVSPVSTVPAERAAYSGKWSGRMDNGVDQILVVEEVADASVRIVFSHNGQSAGWVRVRGSFVDGGGIECSSQPGSVPRLNLHYRLLDDGRLAASADVGGQVMRGYLTKAP